MIIFTQTIAHRHQSNYLVTPNVWHKNHKCWAHIQQSNLIAPKIKIESQMLDCTHILEIVPSPTQGLTGQQTTVQLDNPPNVWHGYQDEVINVGLYTHSRNCSFPPLRAHRHRWSSSSDHDRIFAANSSKRSIGMHWGGGACDKDFCTDIIHCIV